MRQAGGARRHEARGPIPCVPVERRCEQLPGSIDGVTSFMGMRWEDPQTVRLTIRPELINAGGLLSGVVTYALVDYCMGSTLWAQTTADERIATISISINYVQTATEGDVVCRTTLDRRNRRTAVMRSEVVPRGRPAARDGDRQLHDLSAAPRGRTGRCRRPERWARIARPSR